MVSALDTMMNVFCTFYGNFQIWAKRKIILGNKMADILHCLFVPLQNVQMGNQWNTDKLHTNHIAVKKNVKISTKKLEKYAF